MGLTCVLDILFDCPETIGRVGPYKAGSLDANQRLEAKYTSIRNLQAATETILRQALDRYEPQTRKAVMSRITQVCSDKSLYHSNANSIASRVLKPAVGL